MLDKDTQDFIKNCKDPKIAKYLRFRYVGYKERLEKERDERADQTREDRLSEIENRRTERERPK